jgi:hypothetical protein
MKYTIEDLHTFSEILDFTSVYSEREKIKSIIREKKIKSIIREKKIKSIIREIRDYLTRTGQLKNSL